ncbi:DUF6640 family protein [Arthrobacter mobilis]|uniref:Acetyltransferase n=1 Tax=Arthrobacter mobilis TaxID=2724944 RepID=A0A7X6K535_9MICC|nr:DUF6640 family protein [Arthrobacter mobilis]NKX53003.1 acetyltransferase [Arthrobacter mobilis]
MKRPGRSLLRSVAVLTAAGGFAADWNRTHLFNPAWPPHAKFHDAQTIALGALLGGAGLYFLGRDRRGPDNSGGDLLLGALLPALFWLAQGASFAFPNAKGLEAEFPHLVPRIKGVWINERFSSGTMLALSVSGYLLERRAAAVDRRHRLR